MTNNDYEYDNKEQVETWKSCPTNELLAMIFVEIRQMNYRIKETNRHLESIRRNK